MKYPSQYISEEQTNPDNCWHGVSKCVKEINSARNKGGLEISERQRSDKYVSEKGVNAGILQNRQITQPGQNHDYDTRRDEIFQGVYQTSVTGKRKFPIKEGSEQKPNAKSSERIEHNR